jgi:AraC family transcriptional regulator, transcriptional activator of pobA
LLSLAHYAQTNIKTWMKKTSFKNQKKMEIKHQLPAQVRNIHEAQGGCNTVTEMQEKIARKNNAFKLVDSSELELSSLMSPAGTDDAAMLYIDKGEVTLVHDLKTYILSEGMLLYKVPKVTIRLLSCSEDCHFKVFCFAPQFAIGGGMPTTHLETITVIASDDPVLFLDTLTAATVAVLFWLLQKKGSSDEKASSHDETIQHVFSLLMLEIVSSIKRKIADNPCHYSRKVYLTFQFLKLLREHIKEQRSVNFFADLLHVTPKHLSMCVKEITGKNCGEIIGEMVVAEAKTLLHNPELTIGHVADELKFSDQFFFSKYFKKRTGMSPLHYRMAG